MRTHPDVGLVTPEVLQLVRFCLGNSYHFKKLLYILLFCVDSLTKEDSTPIMEILARM